MNESFFLLSSQSLPQLIKLENIYFPTKPMVELVPNSDIWEQIE